MISLHNNIRPDSDAMAQAAQITGFSVQERVSCESRESPSNLPFSRGASPCSESSGYFCRICHDVEGPHGESLLAPCKCSGTGGLVHRTCIEHWLGVANSSCCEICGFKYVVKRHPKPMTRWFFEPSRRRDRRNLMADVACFILLTPLAGVSMWLCLNGAQHFTNNNKLTGVQWETVGLVSLSVFLMLIYIIWCMVAFRYHIRMFKDWRSRNYIVQVVAFDRCTPKTDCEGSRDVNNNDLECLDTTDQGTDSRSSVGPLNSTQHEDGSPAVMYVLDANLSSVCGSSDSSRSSQGINVSVSSLTNKNVVMETSL